MSRAACLSILTAILASISFPITAQQSPGTGTITVAVEADKGDGSAMALAEALREQIRQSVKYRLADGPSDTNVVIHVVGLAIPGCSPSSAIAVSYVSLPMEKHLGTAVLATDRYRSMTSARDVLTKLPQMLDSAVQR